MDTKNHVEDYSQFKHNIVDENLNVCSFPNAYESFNKSRAELTDPAEKEAAKQKARELQQHYDEVLQCFKDMKRYREWSQSAQRELAAIGIDD